MGTDIRLQALPDKFEWWHHKRDRNFWDAIGSVPVDREVRNSWLSRSAAAEAFITANPGIEGRNIDLQRHWDELTYLISDSLRYYLDHDGDLGWIAVRGEKRLDGVTGSQGSTCSYVSPKTVQFVYEYLCELTDEDLRHAYNPERMRGARLYRFEYEAACEAEIDFLINEFHRLRQFYKDLAENQPDEGVLVYVE